MAARQTGTAASGNRKSAAGKKTSSSRNSKTSSSSAKKTVKKNTKAKGVSASKKSGEIDYRQRSGMYDEIEMIIALAVSILLLLSIYNLCGTVGSHISYFIFGVFGWIAFLIPYFVFFGTAFYISNRHNRVAVVKILSGILMFISVAAFLQMLINPGDTYVSVLDFYEDSAVYRNGGGIIGGTICRLLTPLFGIAGTYLIIIAIFAVSVVLFAGKSVFVSILKYIQKASVEAARKYKERRILMDEAREERRIEKENARMAAGDDLDDPEDFDDFPDIDQISSEEYAEEEKSAVFKKSRRSRKKNRAAASMIEPENAYGKTISPLGFEIPKHDENVSQVMDSSSDDHETKEESADIKDMSDLKNEHEEKAEFPDLTITRMENIHKDSDSEFDFSPDPVYMDPEIAEDVIQVPEFMNRNSEPASDPFGTTMPLPKLNGEELKEDLQVKDIREKSIEEKYSNLPEYEPREDDISPLEAVKLAAGRAVSEKKHNSGSEKTAVDNTPQPVTDVEIVPQVKEYVFPPMDLLKRGKPVQATADSDKHLKETAQKLQETLDSFGVKVHVTNVSCGPSVTRYELSPEQGVKVSRILSLTDDIKLNLAVADIRIEAPIPGKAAIGIEVPNKENTTVMLRDLLESNEFKTSKSLIAFAAGRDIGGQVIIADIAKMPHLLIAGATGSGKSVCINTLIMSIIYKAKPEDVRMIMIDPKVVELSVYNGIPHLLIPVVTDPKKAAGALNWAVAEMEKRYAKFAELNVRDMKSYNAKIDSCEYESEEHQRLPQIVIIVDELADLMMVASNEVEDAICRLAQLARAAGIHLVIATQRPSVNVITGLIKANIPSRIAFSVSSGVDSRTIIDMNGAEKLLGKGDMLFYPTGYQKPVRVQGAFVSDQEVNAVVEFLTKDQDKPQYNEAIVNTITSASTGADKASVNDRDVYFVEAGRLIIEKDKASIGMLQRVYRIGFNRAARIMDQLYEAGVVGPEEGTKPRKVLMNQEQFEKYVEEYV